MADSIQATVLPNGPVIIDGPIELKHKDGRTFKTAAKTALCRCGLSGNKPLCDGAHAKQGFEAEDTAPVAE